MKKPAPLSPRFLFVSDMDDTMLGDDAALGRLAEALMEIRGQIVIAYNSSRPCASLKETLAQNNNLPKPDYLIGALGTEIEDFPAGGRIDAYSRNLKAGWQRDKVAALMEQLGFAAHADEFQTEFKASYHAPGDAQFQRVLDHLREAGLNAKVIFSGNKNLDIIPPGADKGKAVIFLHRMLGFHPEQVIVAGDSANDREMFLHTFKGIIVGNADEALQSLSSPNIHHAQSACAAGVLEGLRHWGMARLKPLE
jgi:sucrose-6F-phosphate phosphohydrolase